jgi:hypothetical protein
MEAATGKAITSAVDGAAKPIASTLQSIGNTVDYAKGFVAGAPTPEEEQEKRKRLLEPVPEFRGFAASSF